jgi:hypothetical protein
MPTTQQKMKLYQIAQQAIDEQDAHMAVSLAMYLNAQHGLNAEGISGYLALHGVDWREFDQLLAEA